MASKISEILGLSESEETAVDTRLHGIVSLTEWFSDTVEATKDSPLFEVAGATGDAANALN